MPDGNPIERRLTLRMVAYWEKLRGNRPMPTEDDIDPEDLAELWDYCFLVQVDDVSRQNYHYTYLGSAIVEAYQGGTAADNPGGMVATNASQLSASYGKVIGTCLPVIEDGEFKNLRGETVKYRQCMLPLGSGAQVNAIFGGMRFRVFSLPS